jgi:hypothetical protein
LALRARLGKLESMQMHKTKNITLLHSKRNQIEKLKSWKKISAHQARAAEEFLCCLLKQNRFTVER